MTSNSSANVATSQHYYRQYALEWFSDESLSQLSNWSSGIEYYYSQFYLVALAVLKLESYSSSLLLGVLEYVHAVHSSTGVTQYCKVVLLQCCAVLEIQSTRYSSSLATRLVVDYFQFRSQPHSQLASQYTLLATRGSRSQRVEMQSEHSLATLYILTLMLQLYRYYHSNYSRDQSAVSYVQLSLQCLSSNAA